MWKPRLPVELSRSCHIHGTDSPKYLQKQTMKKQKTFRYTKRPELTAPEGLSVFYCSWTGGIIEEKLIIRGGELKKLSLDIS